MSAVWKRDKRFTKFMNVDGRSVCKIFIITYWYSSPDAGFSARKAAENVWQPDSVRTRWGSISTPSDPLAANVYSTERH